MWNASSIPALFRSILIGLESSPLATSGYGAALLIILIIVLPRANRLKAGASLANHPLPSGGTTSLVLHTDPPLLDLGTRPQKCHLRILFRGGIRNCAAAAGSLMC